MFQAVSGGDVRCSVEYDVPRAAGGRVGEQYMGLCSLDLDALERGLEAFQSVQV